MFDLKVHHKNPKTGKMERVTPYKLRITTQGKVFIRDGIEYYESGELVHKPVVAKPVEKPAEPKQSFGNTLGNVFNKKQVEPAKV